MRHVVAVFNLQVFINYKTELCVTQQDQTENAVKSNPLVLRAILD